MGKGDSRATTGLYGRTISFAGKVCPVEKLRSDLARTTPIRFVVSSFRISGRYGAVERVGCTVVKGTRRPKAKGVSFSLTEETHSPFSLLSTSIMRIPLCRVSLLGFLSPSLPLPLPFCFLSYFTSVSCFVRSVLFAHPLAILCIISLRFLRLAPFSRPQRLPSPALHLCSTLLRGC